MSKTYPVNPETYVPAIGGTEAEVWAALETVEDPELPINIVDFGLVYDVTIDGTEAEIDLTLTYSGCPAKEMIVRDAERAAAKVDGIDDASVRIVYSPPWSFNRITDSGREDLKEHGMSVPDDPDDLDTDCH